MNNRSVAKKTFSLLQNTNSTSGNNPTQLEDLANVINKTFLEQVSLSRGNAQA